MLIFFFFFLWVKMFRIKGVWPHAKKILDTETNSNSQLLHICFKCRSHGEPIVFHQKSTPKIYSFIAYHMCNSSHKYTELRQVRQVFWISINDWGKGNSTNRTSMATRARQSDLNPWTLRVIKNGNSPVFFQLFSLPLMPKYRKSHSVLRKKSPHCFGGPPPAWRQMRGRNYLRRLQLADADHRITKVTALRWGSEVTALYMHLFHSRDLHLGDHRCGASFYWRSFQNRIDTSKCFSDFKPEIFWAPMSFSLVSVLSLSDILHAQRFNIASVSWVYIWHSVCSLPSQSLWIETVVTWTPDLCLPWWSAFSCSPQCTNPLKKNPCYFDWKEDCKLVFGQSKIQFQNFCSPTNVSSWQISCHGGHKVGIFWVTLLLLDSVANCDRNWIEWRFVAIRWWTGGSRLIPKTGNSNIRTSLILPLSPLPFSCEPWTASLKKNFFLNKKFGMTKKFEHDIHESIFCLSCRKRNTRSLWFDLWVWRPSATKKGWTDFMVVRCSFWNQTLQNPCKPS